MATAAYPKWMLDCKTQMTKSEVWTAVTRELHAAIQQELTESHVAQFTDLSEAEKRLLMERAANAIQHGDAYKSFTSEISSSLDHHINQHVAQQTQEEYPTESPTDLVLGQAREGAFGLLRRWPEMKSKIHLCFNQSLPDRLRQMTWKLYLRNPKARGSYLEKVKTDPNSAMSEMDLEIIQKCEVLLQAEATFRSLSHNADILYAMKAVLSYHHARKSTKTNLLDTDYMLVIPLLVHLLTTLKPEQLATDNCRALLVEEYITFMATRPVYMKESFNSEFNAAMQNFVSTVADILGQQHVSKLAHHLEKAFKAANNLDGRDALLEGLKQLVRPMVRCMFVGYLPLDTVLYIWDQYIIGLDTPAYDIIPTMTATALKLLCTTLLGCSTLYQMEEVLKRDTSSLKKEQFMYEIKKNFYQDMFTVLNKDHGRLPVLDPTQMAMPWNQWHSGIVPPTLKDRKQVRDERLSQKQKELKERQPEEEVHLQQQLEETNENEQKEDRQDLETNENEQKEEDRQDLETLLQKERQEREESEKQAQQEIEELKRELELLKSKPPAVSPTKTKPSTPSRQPLTPPRSSLAGGSAEENEETTSAQETTKDIPNIPDNGVKASGQDGTDTHGEPT